MFSFNRDSTLMSVSFNWLGAIAAVVTGVAVVPAHRVSRSPSPTTAAVPCSADPNYQRLAFWVGDWDVLDSAGTHYATQRVRAILDDCAITADWTGPVGDRGLNLSAFDHRTGEWRQVYVSNEVPAPVG